MLAPLQPEVRCGPAVMVDMADELAEIHLGAA
jgi:hypothetical protein